MDTIRNESLIKMALDTIDLLILRRQVDEVQPDGGAAMNRSTFGRTNFHRLPRPAGGASA